MRLAGIVSHRDENPVDHRLNNIMRRDLRFFDDAYGNEYRRADFFRRRRQEAAPKPAAQVVYLPACDPIALRDIGNDCPRDQARDRSSRPFAGRA